MNVNRDDLPIMDYLPTKFETNHCIDIGFTMCGNVWKINMTFDLVLCPTDLNSDHLLTKDDLPTKFEASGEMFS